MSLFFATEQICTIRVLLNENIYNIKGSIDCFDEKKGHDLVWTSGSKFKIFNQLLKKQVIISHTCLR